MTTQTSILRSGKTGIIVDWMQSLQPLFAMAIIAFISIIIKVLYIHFFRDGFGVLPSESDVTFYDGVARVFADSGVYGRSASEPTIEMPPGQSVFLALLYLFSGYSIAFAQIAHVFLMTGVALVSYATAKVVFSPAVGFLTGLLVAIDPAQNFLAGTFLSEPLFIFSMMLGIHLLVVERVESRSWQRPILAGIMFAVAGLTRNQGWPFPVVILAASLLSAGRVLPVRSAIIACCFTVLLVMPWTIRNYVLVESFVPVSAEGGLTFWASNNPEFTWRPPMPMSTPLYERPSGLSSVEIDDYYYAKSFEWIQNNPFQFFFNGIKKVIILFHFDPVSQQSDRVTLFRVAGLVPYGLMLPFIVGGLIRYFRDSKTWLILLYILYTTALAFLFFGDSRVRAPIQPYLYMFGTAWILAWLESRWSRGEGKVRATHHKGA